VQRCSSYPTVEAEPLFQLTTVVGQVPVVDAGRVEVGPHLLRDPGGVEVEVVFLARVEESKPGSPTGGPTWIEFLRSQAPGVLASDFWDSSGFCDAVSQGWGQELPNSKTQYSSSVAPGKVVRAGDGRHGGVDLPSPASTVRDLLVVRPAHCDAYTLIP
jgi:hypothetical protein